MANLKNITDVPVAESAEGLNLIANDNGVAKQIAASAVGAQADWNIEDTSSPAYIKNKPIIPEGFSGSWNDLSDKPFYVKNENSELIHCFGYKFSGLENDASGNPYFNIDGSDIINQTPFIIEINGRQYEDTITYWEEGNSYFGAIPWKPTEEKPYCITFSLDENNSVPNNMRYISLHESIASANENTIYIFKKEEKIVLDVQQLEAKYLPYDLIFEYQGEFDGYDGRQLHYNFSEIKKVIEKLEKEENVRVAFRWNVKGKYNTNRYIFMAEYPMTLTGGYSEDDGWSLLAQTTVPFETEGFAIARISILFNEYGIQGFYGQS